MVGVQPVSKRPEASRMKSAGPTIGCTRPAKAAQFWWHVSAPVQPLLQSGEPKR